MVTYADRPWTQYYDEFVPPTLDYPTDKVLHDFLRETAQKNPNTPALVTTAKLPVIGRQDAHLTYRQLDDYSDAFAAALVDMGLQKGETVAIVMPNCAAFAIAYWGILKAGGIVSATNPTYPPKRMAYQINDCNATVIICLMMFYNLIKEIQSETQAKAVIVANIKDYLPTVAKILFTLTAEKKGGHRIDTLHTGDKRFLDVLNQYKGQSVTVDVSPDDVAVFQYTGGTTGVSKGAMGTHFALLSNLIAIQTWVGFPAGHYDHLGIMRYVGAIPMFHVYGLLVLLTQCAAVAGSIILIPNARIIDEVVDVIDYYKPHVFLGVPALYNAINNHPRIQSGEVSLKSLILNASGSAPLPTQTKKEFDERAGSPISEGYGMSETFTAVCSNPRNGEQKIRSVGLPYPDIDVKVVAIDDPDTELPIGDVGELVVSGPNLMKGYHGMPTETANMIRQDENGKKWLYTGDIVRMDEQGYLFIVDRKKDMALIGGFNVYPATVENILKQHPAVFEVGVAAIPHPKKEGQEALKAWIVLKPNMSATEEELSKHCESYLAKYEIPRRFAFITELPKTAVGKTLRRELVQMEMAEAESQRH
ncbi:MAG: AMP-binding protein [Anaerolineae bacterium]|nr:AMP-binding protein [Anaerolineae bacterium]MDQ7033529.1 AMP-binding protein [Anaerolineae bacterium]